MRFGFDRSTTFQAPRAVAEAPAPIEHDELLPPTDRRLSYSPMPMSTWDAVYDRAAREADKIMRQNPRYQTHELGAYFWHNPETDEVDVGPVTLSESGRFVTTPENFAGSPGTKWIRGVIHSHPDIARGDNKELPSPYQYYDDVHDAWVNGDVKGYEDLASQVREKGGDPSELRYYISAPKGLYKYDSRNLPSYDPKTNRPNMLPPPSLLEDH